MTTAYPLEAPKLTEIIEVLRKAVDANYAHADVTVTDCPDLRKAPFNLAAEGLGGSPVIADIGGQPNLFPEPVLDKKYDMVQIARDKMNMSSEQGMLIGAGAGPFHVVGMNSELAPNIAWNGGFDNVTNLTHFTKVERATQPPSSACEKCPSTDCALMMNLYGSSGLPGPVICIKARRRTGDVKSFTDVIRFALTEAYGDARPVSMGGVFLIRRGKANFHIMPDFPSAEELPFKNAKQLNDWLTYHDFKVKGQGQGDEIVCLSVLHSADPEKKMGLRMEHTHCFSSVGYGGHYHYDINDADSEEIEYEGYFNIAETIYRVDRPQVTLERDLHD